MPVRAKQWITRHPLGGLGVLASAWYLAVLGCTSLGAGRWLTPVAALAAALIPLAVVAACGWWREAGLRWQRPDPRWLLVVLPLIAVAAVPHAYPVSRVGYALIAGFSVETVARGAGQFAVRRYGPWRSSLLVAIFFAAAPEVLAPQGLANVAAPAGWAQLLTGAVVGFCLCALRWRLATIWPLVCVQAVHVYTGTLPWWALVGLAGYGCLLLRRYPTVRMAARPTVRVLCFDEHDRILMIGWHDPSNGTLAWDLPGGGIQPGETPVQAARRELYEESGLPGDCVVDRFVVARRDAYWNGTRYVGDESFYLARVEHPGEPTPAGLESHEAALMRERRWVAPPAAAGLPGRVQLTALARIAARLRDPLTAPLQPVDP
jgi:8-oxo-dGTP pyrophosphatase MutT (NUDIX family)